MDGGGDNKNGFGREVGGKRARTNRLVMTVPFSLSNFYNCYKD